MKSEENPGQLASLETGFMQSLNVSCASCYSHHQSLRSQAILGDITKKEIGSSREMHEFLVVYLYPSRFTTSI